MIPRTSSIRSTAVILVLTSCFAQVLRLPAAPPEKLYQTLADQVVFIETFDDLRRPLKQGSGVVLGRSLCVKPPFVALDPAYQKADTNGIDILSNFHVIAFAHQIFIQTKSGTRSLAAVVFGDSDKDLAILRTAGSASASPADFADAPKVGQKVYAIGAPKGLGWTFSDGLVSGLREQGSNKLVQTTAPISPGSSGGGLFDEGGKLVGITTLQFEDGQNLNFARSLGPDDRAELTEARKEWSVRPAGIEYDEWVVGVVRRPVGSDGSWRQNHPKWQQWQKLNSILEQLGRDEMEEYREPRPPHVKELTAPARGEVFDARPVLRSYYLAKRYNAFQSDIEGLLANIRLEGTAAFRLRTDKRIIPSAATAGLDQIAVRRQALIQSIPDEFKNRIEVVDLHFSEALFDRKSMAVEILTKFLQDLPEKPKDAATDSVELNSRVQEMINFKIETMMYQLEQVPPRSDASPLRAILREKGWSVRANRPEK